MVETAAHLELKIWGGHSGQDAAWVLAPLITAASILQIVATGAREEVQCGALREGVDGRLL